MPQLGRLVEIVGGFALLLLSRGVWQRLAVAWCWVLGLLLATAVAAIIAGAPVALPLYLMIVALSLLACRGVFDARHDGTSAWQSPAIALLLAVTLASSVWLIARG